jgi:hypothetical protein
VAKSICSLEGCERLSERIGLCMMHYRRQARYGTTGSPSPMTARARGTLQCAVPGCDRQRSARDLCHHHYKQVLLVTGPLRKHARWESPALALASRVKVAASGCHEWTGAAVQRGYGVLTVGGQGWLAHRLSWVLHNGPVPDGLELDHLCRNPRCVKPDHLEPVTPAENVRRSIPYRTRKVATC